MAFWAESSKDLTSDETLQQECTNINDFGITIKKNRRQIKALVVAMETQNKLLNAMAYKMDPTLVSNDISDSLDLDIEKLNTEDE
jgi:hypothetical protein